jgi:hypothetical protein
LQYSATVAQGDRLASGLFLGRDIELHYGLLPTLLLAIYERHSGVLSFAGHVRMIQVSQIVFLVAALYACYSA